MLPVKLVEQPNVVLGSCVISIYFKLVGYQGQQKLHGFNADCDRLLCMHTSDIP